MSRLDIIFEEGRIVVRGSGVAFLRVKSELAKTHDGSLLSIDRNAFAVPIESAHLLKNLADAESVNVDSASREKITEEFGKIESHVGALIKIREIIESGRSETDSAFWNEILDPHQGVAVNCATIEGLLGLCLFDEQGTGKTLVSIAAYDILRDANEIDALVVTGPKSLLHNWKKEIDTFLSNKFSIVLIEGTLEEKYRKLYERADVYLMTYESIDSLLSPLKALARNKRILLTVDESYFIKNPDAKRSTSIREFRKNCQRAFVLCGTPAPNRPEDIIHQFDVADNGYTFEKFSIPKDDKKAFDAITERVYSRGAYIRRTKSEVLPDLPAKEFNKIWVDMTGRQKTLYEKARSDLAIYLKSMDNRTFKRCLATYFQKRAAMLQICVSPSLIDPLATETPAKYAALDLLLEKLIVTDRLKVIVWSVYTKTLDDLQNKYSTYGVVRVDGTVIASQDRERAVRAFQEDDNIKLFIGNPMAAGAGLTLHAAADSVYLSFSNQAATYLQSLDRTHRRGQKASKVNYYVLLCRETIEEHEFNRLMDKEQRQRNLLSDPDDNHITLDRALEEILGGR
jgi:SNF2 family DNA or RNA helicase